MQEAWSENVPTLVYKHSTFTYGNKKFNASSSPYLNDSCGNFFKDFNQRHAGLYYPFEYTSSFEKDGKNHLVKIDSKDGQSGFSLPVPSKNVFELIQENPIVSLLVFILLLGLIVVIIFLFKKNKLKKEELEMQRKKDFEEMEQNLF